MPAPPALKLPAVRTATLPNGLQLAVVEIHKVPVVDVSLVLDAGAVRDPANLPGLATFTATMLQQGAGRRSALDIADGFSLRQRQKRDAIARFADQNLQIVLPRGMADVVDARADTPEEVVYYRHGGILQYVLRQML